MNNQDLDIDIHLPHGNEQLPAQLFRRFDQQLKHINPMIATALGVYGFTAFQSLGALARLYLGTGLMWWAVLLLAIAVSLSILLPSKYRLVYLIALVFSIGVGLIWR